MSTRKHINLILLVVAIVLFVFIFFSANPVSSVIHSGLLSYLKVPEYISNILFKLSRIQVQIQGHEFIFENQTNFQEERIELLQDWKNFVFYRNWIGIILFFIWFLLKSIRRKIKFTLIFILVHFLSVLSNLIVIGIISPLVFEFKPDFFVPPTLIGNLFMFTYLIIIIKLCSNEIFEILSRYKIKLEVSDRKLNEIIIVIFILFILRNYFVYYFEFHHYVVFMLKATKWIVSLFGFEGYISEHNLIGIYGKLYVSKHCLGILAMYIFAAFIFLARIQKNYITVSYIIVGLTLINIINIIRLVLLYIVVERGKGTVVAEYHHEAYNIIIYGIIFVFWVIWYEVFILNRRIFHRNKEKNNSPRKVL